MRNDQIAIGHAGDPRLFVRITDLPRGKWEFVEGLEGANTFETELQATRALVKLFRTRTPAWMQTRKVVAC